MAKRAPTRRSEKVERIRNQDEGELVALREAKIKCVLTI